MNACKWCWKQVCGLYLICFREGVVGGWIIMSGSNDWQWMYNINWIRRAWIQSRSWCCSTICSPSLMSSRTSARCTRCVSCETEKKRNSLFHADFVGPLEHLGHGFSAPSVFDHTVSPNGAHLSKCLHSSIYSWPGLHCIVLFCKTLWSVLLLSMLTSQCIFHNTVPFPLYPILHSLRQQATAILSLPVSWRPLPTARARL